MPTVFASHGWPRAPWKSISARFDSAESSSPLAQHLRDATENDSARRHRRMDLGREGRVDFR